LVVLRRFLGAPAKGVDANVEFAIMPSTMDVTLLNEGGKFVAIDMMRIAKGEKRRMDKNTHEGRTPHQVAAQHAPLYAPSLLPDLFGTVCVGRIGQPAWFGRSSRQRDPCA
jgi:hypothetical protein